METAYDVQTYGLSGVRGVSDVFVSIQSLYTRSDDDSRIDWDAVKRTIHDIQDKSDLDGKVFLNREEIVAGLQGKSMHDFYADAFDGIVESMDDEQKIAFANQLYPDRMSSIMASMNMPVENAMIALKSSDAADRFADYMVAKNAEDRGFDSVEDYETAMKRTQEVVFGSMSGNVEVGMYSDAEPLTELERYNQQLDAIYGQEAEQEQQQEAEQEQQQEAEQEQQQEAEQEQQQEAEQEQQQEAEQDTPNGDSVEEDAPVAGKYGTQGAGVPKDMFRPAEWDREAFCTYIDRMQESGFLNDSLAGVMKALAPALEQLGVMNLVGNSMADSFEAWSGYGVSEGYEAQGVGDEGVEGPDVDSDGADLGEEHQSEQMQEAGTEVSGEEESFDEMDAEEAAEAIDEETKAAEDAEVETEQAEQAQSSQEEQQGDNEPQKTEEKIEANEGAEEEETEAERVAENLGTGEITISDAAVETAPAVYKGEKAAETAKAVQALQTDAPDAVQNEQNGAEDQQLIDLDGAMEKGGALVSHVSGKVAEMATASKQLVSDGYEDESVAVGLDDVIEDSNEGQTQRQDDGLMH